MSTRLGSNSRPSWGYEWSGVNTYNQVAHALTFPGGGPWRVVTLGAWLAGKSASVNVKLAIWDSTRNTVLGSSAEFTAPSGGSGGNGQSDSYEKAVVTPFEVAGGATVYVGWSRDEADVIQWDINSSGSHYDDTDTTGSWPGSAPRSMSGEVLDSTNGGIGAWLYYELANSVPNAPTSMTPTGGTITGLTPTLSFTHSDPDSDAITTYDLQVSTDSTFASVTHWTVTDSTTGIVGNDIDRTYGGTALTRGTTYYWRARTNDGTGDGAWSAAQQFKVAVLPTMTITEPSASGRLGKLSFTAGSGWASPRFNVAWTFGCTDGGTQSHYEVEVYNDTAGSPGSSLYDSGAVAGTATSLVVPATLTEGSYYHVRGQVTCSHGEVSGFTGYFRVRTRWGLTEHEKDLVSAPTAWSISTLNTTTGASSAVTVEYNSSADGTTLPDAWKSDISSVTLRRYMRYRVWLMAWGASPATSPSLDRLVLSYTATVLTPDVWTREDTVNSYASEAAYVYGTQSLQHTGDAGSMNTYQQVIVTPNTDYILSGRIKSSGNSGAQIIISTAGTSGSLASSTSITATADWGRYSTAIWNSGSNTSVFIRCFTNGAVGTSAWFDAIKMEASRVVTPWNPGFVGSAVVLDAGGVQVDAQAGGVFRLRATNGGTRDRVDLGARGLKFGNDTTAELYSPSARQLSLDGMLALAQDGSDDALKIGDDAVIFDADLANKFGIKGVSDATAGGIVFGSAKDTNLYRSAANELKTDDALQVGGAYIGGATSPITRVYTSGSGSWSKPTGIHHIKVYTLGGGGGGAGADATTASQYSGGGGGGGGGLAVKTFSAADLAGASSFSYAVGGSGSGGNNTGTGGGTGGNSTFSGTGITTVQGNGGGGGEGGAATSGISLRAGGAGGTASGGDYNMTGSDGLVCFLDGGRKSFGTGGPSAGGFGGGGRVNAADGGGAGDAGGQYGGGGGAGQSSISTAGYAGGAGAAGIVIVEEYYAP